MGIEADVRQAVVTLIQGIPNIGNVYDRYKYSSNWQSFLDQFMWQDPDTGFRAPRGWWVSLPTMTEYPQGRSFDEHWHTYTYPIRGILGVSDKANSEGSFDTLIWQVVDVLHDQGTLGQGPGVRADQKYVVDASPDIDVPIVEIRAFGSTLCHFTEMRFSVGIAHPVNNVP